MFAPARRLLFVLLVGLLAAGWPAGPHGPAATAAPAVTSPHLVSAVTVSQVGLVTDVDDPSGVKLAIAFDRFTDPSVTTSVPPGGRWAELDLTITNTGLTDVDLSPTDFWILSTDATVFQASQDPNLPVPQFAETNLAAGQSTNAAIIFTLPWGKAAQSAFFQAPGMAQYTLGLVPD